MNLANFSHKNSTIVLINALIRHASLPRMRDLRRKFAHGMAYVAMRVMSTSMPRRALDIALDRFITPPRFPYSGLEQRLMDRATRIDLATPFGTLAVWRMGAADRPAVVLSHGWGGRGAQLRGFVAPLLDAGYQVVFFDHFGHGSSTGRQAALVDFWRGVEAVWDHLIESGTRVEAMVSHSLGCAGVASALRRPLSRRHLNAPNPRVVLIAPPASLIRYSQLFARYFGISERIRHAMQWRFEQRYGVAWREFELPHSVASIRAPALFIHDRQDRETRFAGGLALAQAWSDAKMIVTDGLGHRRILRDADVINAAVDFIADRVRFLPPPESAESIAAKSVAPLY
jgi:pimeloyl-ACP methyl ester carboxylesterase